MPVAPLSPRALAAAGALAAGALAAGVPAAAQPPAAPAPPLVRTSADTAALSLEEAVALAQARGLAARNAQRALDAARHRERAFDARFLPRLTLSGQAADLNRGINPVTLPTGETDFVRQSQNVSSVLLGVAQPLPWTATEITVGSRLTRVDQFGEQANTQLWQTQPFVLGIRQSLFRPRALHWDRQEQDLAVVVAERAYLEAREDVASATSAAFFDLYAAQMSLDNATANAAVNDTLYTLNEGRYEVGKIGENDLLQSELALLRSRAEVDGARLQRDRAAAALRRLLRLPADAAIAAGTPPTAPAYAIDPAVAVSQALRHASAMPETELQVLRTRRGVAEARSAAGFRADIQASLGFDARARGFDDAYAQPLARQQFAMAVDMPLMQWGAGRASVAAARAEQERAEGVAELRRETIEEDARFAALQLAQANRLLALSAKADTVAAKRFEVAKNRYVIGRIGIGELYIAQSEKDAAVASYVQALRGYWTAHYRLRRLTLYDFVAGREIAAQDP